MLIVSIDGSTDQMKNSAIGFVAQNNKIYIEGFSYIGHKSNHEAEFHAVLFALQTLAEDFPHEILAIHSDSKLVVDTMEKGYVKNITYQAYYDEIKSLLPSFSFVFFKWIRDNQNKHADLLAKTGLLKKTTVIKQRCK